MVVYHHAIGDTENQDTIQDRYAEHDGLGARDTEDGCLSVSFGDPVKIEGVCGC